MNYYLKFSSLVKLKRQQTEVTLHPTHASYLLRVAPIDDDAALGGDGHLAA